MYKTTQNSEKQIFQGTENWAKANDKLGNVYAWKTASTFGKNSEISMV
jgi:hypothetical protein